jgi:alcohol dehydrogenase class IV
MAPVLAQRAGAVHDVASGRVDEIAGALLGEVDPGEPIVALGGGRVIDTAKALAAARAPGQRPLVAAVPTTLSAAEMTGGHRRAAGADGSLPGVRPARVVNDPALSASQPVVELAASAANALAHAAEGQATRRASPVPSLAGREAARLIGEAYADGDAPDRDTLALAALLSGYTIDSAGYGLHHVLSQTLARFAGVWHGHANAALLPHTTVALRRRAPDALAALDAAAGVEMEVVARRLAHQAGAQQLQDLGVTEEALETCVGEVMKRGKDLDGTPPAPSEPEVRSLYEAAF